MQLYQYTYYHIFNRSINQENLFYANRHYQLFLAKIFRLRKFLTFHAYCVMPTHFHILVHINHEDQNPVRRSIGDILSGYTKAINRQTGRTGSLFQQHTKAKAVQSEKYLLTTLHYIHQNPVVAGLVRNLEDWSYSSYREYIGICPNYFVDKSVILRRYRDLQDFIDASHNIVDIMTV